MRTLDDQTQGKMFGVIFTTISFILIFPFYFFKYSSILTTIFKQNYKGGGVNSRYPGHPLQLAFKCISSSVYHYDGLHIYIYIHMYVHLYIQYIHTYIRTCKYSHNTFSYIYPVNVYYCHNVLPKVS